MIGVDSLYEGRVQSKSPTFSLFLLGYDIALMLSASLAPYRLAWQLTNAGGSEGMHAFGGVEGCCGGQGGHVGVAIHAILA